MFDYRYHALSLAAVLFALAVGVLIGVAIGDSNLVSSAKRRDRPEPALGSERLTAQARTARQASCSDEETLASDL